MMVQRPRDGAALFLRVFVAHVIGLWIVGVLGTIGTTAGFSLSGGGLGLFLGGILSLPWLAVLLVVIHFYGGWIERHPVAFALTGPPLVDASYAVSFGGFLDAGAIASASASAFFLLLTWLGTRAMQARLTGARQATCRILTQDRPS